LAQNIRPYVSNAPTLVIPNRYIAALQGKTINSALLALRKQIIRANGDGMDHVEAMLVIRGVHMPAILPAKLPDVADKGSMRT
jgi:hypothetical protein|tara:strand:+ start:587 stop:835 length:249 start_codon:yes stop_codon:yes gene_type:complete